MKLAVLACSLAFSCAEPPPAEGPVRDPNAAKHLDEATKEHERIRSALAEVPDKDREKCEFEAGDCMILVGEQREQLTDTERLGSCNVMPELEDKLRCLSKEFVRLGKEADLAAFYEFGNDCSRHVLECTGQLKERAALAAVEVRANQRRDELELGSRKIAAGPIAARARIEYLRATLPPPASGACASDGTADTCLASTADTKRALEEELRKDDYDASRAAALFQETAQAETRCFEPQASCLTKALENYGLYPESRKWLARNLSTIGDRAALSVRLPGRTRADCLTGPSADHQDRIIGAFTAYVREPVLFFRIRLEKEFLAMHQAQIGCLTTRVKQEPKTKDGNPSPVASATR